MRPVRPDYASNSRTTYDPQYNQYLQNAEPSEIPPQGVVGFVYPMALPSQPAPYGMFAYLAQAPAPHDNATELTLGCGPEATALIGRRNVPLDGPTVNDLRDRLAEAGFSSRSNPLDFTVLTRIRGLSTSIDTLLQTIDIANSPEHPVMQQPNTYFTNRYQVLFSLQQLFNSRNLNEQATKAIQEGNNNPILIVSNLIHARPYRRVYR